MQPARLGAQAWCIVACALLGILVLAPLTRAQQQAVLETPQQVNDRIRSLSASVRLAQHDYVIGSGDLLDVDVFDVKELSREVRVSQTGLIGIPLVPVRLHVAGLTEIQAEQKIAEVLEANGLVSHPQVSVSVKERKSKPITVVGAVIHPMVYQAERSVTILEVLAEAGGLANDAGDTVIVTRALQDPPADPSEPPAIGSEDPSVSNHVSNAAKDSSTPGSGVSSQAAAPSASNSAVPASPSAPPPLLGFTNPSPPNEPPPMSSTSTITINLNQLMESGEAANNIVLQAGDIVTVPHAGIVYVLGAVTRPGGFVLANDRGQLSALKVLALAGGLNRTAKKDRAVIIRKDNQGQQHEVAVDLKKVLERHAEDVQLQPSDILYVPESTAKQAMLRTMELGIALGSGVALYRIAYH